MNFSQVLPATQALSKPLLLWLSSDAPSDLSPPTIHPLKDLLPTPTSILKFERKAYIGGLNQGKHGCCRAVAPGEAVTGGPMTVDASPSTYPLSFEVPILRHIEDRDEGSELVILGPVPFFISVTHTQTRTHMHTHTRTYTHIALTHHRVH